MTKTQISIQAIKDAKTDAKIAGNSKFTLRRRGQFHVATSGPNHCGVGDELDIKYSLTCTCTFPSLDSRGFLFDQMNVDRYFQTIKTVSESCEQFTVTSARQIFRLVARENPGCKIVKIALTLSPAPFAADLTFEWSE